MLAYRENVASPAMTPSAQGLPSAFRTVGLFGKYQNAGIAPVVTALAALLRERGLNVLLEKTTATVLGLKGEPSRPFTDIGREIDLAIVVGGDGTMLHVACELAAHGVPLIGINLGRLGFLTDIKAENMAEELGRILGGDYQIESRMLLTAEVMRQGRIAHRAVAFNDVIINKGDIARLIELETYIGGEFVYSTRCDGIIVSSPTGSTAYALSAGGPILYPTLAAITVVPICPHTLSNRPLVVSSDSSIEVVIAGVPNQMAHATFDGQSMFALEDHDRVNVRRADAPVRLVHPSSRSYYDVLREKLHWGRKL